MKMNRTRDRPNIENIKNFLTGVLIFLITISIVAVSMSFFPKKDKIPIVSDKNDATKEYISFGGKIVKYWNFDEELELSYIDGASYFGDCMKIAPKKAAISFNNKSLDITSNSDSYSGTSTDVFAIIGYQTQTMLNEISYYMIDVDIGFTDSYPYMLRFNPDVRNDSYSLKIEGCSQIKYQDGVIYANSLKKLKDVDKNSFHLTYLFDTNKTALVYINGEFVGSFEDIYQDDATYCDGLKITVLHDFAITDEITLSVDNVVLTEFIHGYDGAISELFDDYSMSLYDNSDTMLYQNSFGYEASELTSSEK